MKRSSTTTTAPDATSTTETTVETVEVDPVVEVYLDFWTMYVELGGLEPPFDPAVVTPRLDELTTGASRAQLFEFFQGNAATGLVLRGDMEHSPAVESNDGTVAVVRDCLDDRTGVYRVADGSRVESDDPARHLLVAQLRFEDGRWKVESMSQEGTCEL